MFAPAIERRRLLWFLVAALLIMLLVPLLLGAPEAAAPPVGTWNGQTDDSRTLSLTVTEDHGFYLNETAMDPVVGVWTWEAISETTGIMTCQPADWPQHPPVAFNVTWLGANRIELSCFRFRAVLVRMY